MCLPIKGQYEQFCNAESIKRFDVPIVQGIDKVFSATVNEWLSAPSPKKLSLSHSTGDIVQHVIEKALAQKENRCNVVSTAPVLE